MVSGQLRFSTDEGLTSGMPLRPCAWTPAVEGLKFLSNDGRGEAGNYFQPMRFFSWVPCAVVGDVGRRRW